MRSLLSVATAILFLAGSLLASDLPTVKTALPDVTAVGDTVAPIDLRNYFEITDIHGQVVQFRTTQGNYNVETLPSAAPLSVANFLNYVTGARYTKSFIHRSDKSLGVIQGGGFYVAAENPLDVQPLVTDPPVVLEYNLPNVRGTLSMARTNTLNSGTSQWFVNTVDNTTTLGQANGGGYAVFARVTGTGMSVVDAIQNLPVFAFNSPYGQLPLTGYSGSGAVAVENLVVVNAAEAVPIFPATAGQNSVVTFSVANTNPSLLTATVSGSSLNIAVSPGQTGYADLTVTATDTNGNSVQDTFRCTIDPGTPGLAVAQPAGNPIANGGSRAFPLINVGTASDLTFTITNTGNGTLTLPGTPKVTLDGVDATMFHVVVQPVSPVPASGGSTTFSVRFAPTSGGVKHAALHIASSDTLRSPFDISLSGTGNAPPALTLPNSPIVVAPTSPAGAVVNFSVSAYDAEDAASITPTVTWPSGSTFPVGDTAVYVSATDSLGAVSTNVFTVRVNFTRPSAPVVNLHSLSGQPAPGAGTGGLPSDLLLGVFGPPAISDFRSIAARVDMVSGRTLLSGIFQESSAGTGSLAAYQGGPVPGIPTAGVTFSKFADPVIAPGGALAFYASLRGPGITTTNDFGVWTNAFGGSMQMILREGNDVPGLPAGAKLQSISSLSLRDGELLAVVGLRRGGGVALANDTVLLRLTSATSATVLLREGTPLEGQPGTTIQDFSVLRPALGSEGQGRWHENGLIVAKVHLYDGRTLLVKIAADGTVTPILSNGVLATPISPSARWLDFGLPAMGAPGANFAVLASLRPRFDGVTTANDNALLFSPDGTAWSVFAREGDTAPLTPSGPRYATLLDPVANDAGAIAFIASLRGPGVTAQNGAALFAGLPGNVKAIAQLGAFAPDETGTPTTAVWSKLTTCALPGGTGAGVVFLGETTGGDTTTANKLALWAVDSKGTLRRLLRTADHPTMSGTPITSITLLNATPASYGVARSYNTTGSLAVQATFADRSQSILRLDIP